MAKGKPHRLDELVMKLSGWLQRGTDEPEEEIDEIVSERLNVKAAEAAAMRVRVMSAIRWQVFKRDQWKCVVCGRKWNNGAL